MISSGFSLRSTRDGSLHRLTPTGDLDIASAPVLELTLDAAQSDEATTMIVLDLTELGFIDSSGLGVLVRAAASCGAADRLRIINGSQVVERMLDLSGVRSALPIISPTDDPLAPLV